MINEQKRLPLAETLDEFLAGEPAYFCIPGHRFERGISPELKKRFSKDVFKYDLTEANGLDDLHNASGAIKEAQELTAQLYGSKSAKFLVNGTTCGNEALVLACAYENDEIIIARNCHQSVISGIVLSGAKPVWIMPRFDDKWGFYKEVSADAVEDAIRKHPKAKAVFITSPTYYGVLSDIRKISEICHENNMPLLVDEAHGSHLYFDDSLPTGAIRNGADVVVMSMHKTAGSMTQSSVLHICSSRISERKVEAALRMVMSSSPSYVLMTSLDCARGQLAFCGKEIMKKAAELSSCLRRELEKIDGIEVFGGSGCRKLFNNKIDTTRVTFSARSLNISGFELSDILFKEYGISLEMADSENAVAVVTRANTQGDIDRLINALRNFASRQIDKLKGKTGNCHCSLSEYEFLKNIPLPKQQMTLREAYFADTEEISVNRAEGRISAQSIAPYPPGIPIINPGELIDDRMSDILMKCNEKKIQIHSYGSSRIDNILVVRS